MFSSSCFTNKIIVKGFIDDMNIIVLKLPFDVQGLSVERCVLRAMRWTWSRGMTKWNKEIVWCDQKTKLPEFRPFPQCLQQIAEGQRSDVVISRDHLGLIWGLLRTMHRRRKRLFLRKTVVLGWHEPLRPSEQWLSQKGTN